MKRLIFFAVSFAALLVPVAVLASGGSGSPAAGPGRWGEVDGGFDSVVGSLESRYHAHATRIPFIGLVSLVSRKATHNGVANLHLAEFEDFSAPVDGDELNTLVTEKLGSGWERMIRETSRKDNEQTLIFTRPEGKRMGMFIVDLDGDDMNIVQISVDPDHLSESIGQYDHHHHDDNSDDDDSN